MQNSQEERGGIKSEDFCVISLRCDIQKYGTTDTPECKIYSSCILRGWDLRRNSKNSQIMLHVLIPNFNFIINIFLWRHEVQRWKKNGFCSTLGGNQFKELWRDDNCVSVTPGGCWDGTQKHGSAVEAVTYRGKQAEFERNIGRWSI